MSSTRFTLNIIASSLLIFSINIDAMDEDSRAKSEKPDNLRRRTSSQRRNQSVSPPKKRTITRTLSTKSLITTPKTVDTRTANEKVPTTASKDNNEPNLGDSVKATSDNASFDKITNETTDESVALESEDEDIDLTNNTENKNDEAADPPDLISSSKYSGTIDTQSLIPLTTTVSEDDGKLEFEETDIEEHSNTQSHLDYEGEMVVKHYTGTWTFLDFRARAAVILAKSMIDDPTSADQVRSDFTEKTNARNTMRHGLNYFLTKNETELKDHDARESTELQHLSDPEVQAKSAELLILQAQLLTKRDRRLEACYVIVQSEILQPDSEMLKDCYKACVQEQAQAEKFMQTAFSFGVHSRQRSQLMRNRIYTIMTRQTDKIVHEPQDIDDEKLLQQLMAKTTAPTPFANAEVDL